MKYLGSLLLPAIFIPTLFLIILIATGCQKDSEPAPDKFDIFENHDIPACGVEDPLLNIGWVAAYTDEHSTSYSIEMYVFRNESTDTDYIIIETASAKEEGLSPSPIYTKAVYSCTGEQLLFHGTEGPYPAGWDEFFASASEVALLWSVKKQE